MVDIVSDKQLTTLEEIQARMSSITKQIDKLENSELRDNSISAFTKKHAKIAKLNARYDTLWCRRAAILKDK